jgi:hypothetical protein
VHFVSQIDLGERCLHFESRKFLSKYLQRSKRIFLYPKIDVDWSTYYVFLMFIGELFRLYEEIYLDDEGENKRHSHLYPRPQYLCFYSQCGRKTKRCCCLSFYLLFHFLHISVVCFIYLLRQWVVISSVTFDLKLSSFDSFQHSVGAK